VRIPLHAYTELIEQARHAAPTPRPAPAGFALGHATVTVQVADDTGRLSGAIAVELEVEVLEDQWVVVPILPPGTAVESVTVDGHAVQLTHTTDGLGWATNRRGAHTLQLRYHADAVRTGSGLTLALPLPRAAAMALAATLPGAGLDVAVIPSAGTRVETADDTTRVTATIPTTSGVQLSWRAAVAPGRAISRAIYTGTLSGEAVSWSVEFGVDLFHEGSVTLPLLPRTVTLSDLRVDGRSSPIVFDGDHFATTVKGRGTHTIAAAFQVPVTRGDRVPRVALQIPEIPVSRFDLTLPGRKEVAVSPQANVTYATRDGTTVATAHVPLTREVTFTWTEAVPADLERELRANASLFHSIHAEDEVVVGRATVVYEVTRGETSQVELEVVPGVHVNGVRAESGVVADWRLAPAEGVETRTMTVFLNRPVRGEIQFDVEYDQPLGDALARPFAVALLAVRQVHRQRGMVALLTSKEFTLNPVEEARLMRVGENQLPAPIRQAIPLKVAHTYKYVDAAPRLVVAAAPPERVRGKFDAQVDTLISLADAVLKGTATVEINVKSGTLAALQLVLPAGVNVLSVSAPSRRTHTVTATPDGQRIDLEFTQEMEGQFRVDVGYERILDESAAEAAVPALRVSGAEVEQGRIAVEALTTVEVRAAGADHLTALDPSELPQQLLLKTTNPILLAYKYVQADPPPALALRMTRHEAIDVQRATIDVAAYRTLVTMDGLAVTLAEFAVRNRREQFLRVHLPDGSRVWSVFVNGLPEKPALARNGDAGAPGVLVLIKIINSTQGFPVQIVYATPVAAAATFGTVASRIPRPEMVVTHSRWELFLPDQLRYGRPWSNMNLVDDVGVLSRAELQAEVDRMNRSLSQPVEPLRLTVPTAGVRYVFEKLYANQAADEARVVIPYATRTGTVIAWAASALGMALLWLGLALLVQRRLRAGFALCVAGIALVTLTVGYLGVSAWPAAVVSLPTLAAIGIRNARSGSAQLAADVR
jgi:hypothetical protein